MRRVLRLIPIPLHPFALLLGRRQRQELSVGDPDLALARLALDRFDQSRQSQPLFDQSPGHAEAGGDGLHVLPQLHQPGERLVLVERFHRQAFEIFGQRDFQRRRVVTPRTMLQTF